MFRGLSVLLSCLILSAVPFAAGRADEKHWSLRPRGRPAIPAFQTSSDQAWLRNPIDAFILARLRMAGLRPAAEADRRTLIRRVTFDLTGLPPTPAEVETFVRDTAANAYEKLIDRLLASPQYGEKWARHWLDVVRYAETEGFEYDRYLPGAWRYRDYVIRAFNQDKPYDRFVTEQLAGDELPGAGEDARIAAGFYRLGPVRRNAGNEAVAFSRHEVLTERTDVLGAVFLGLTVGCARCHDHKFDDIPQADYYRLQAYLAAAHEDDLMLADAATVRAWKERTAAAGAVIKRMKQKLAAAQGTDRDRLEAAIKDAERRLPPPLPTITSVRNVPAERLPVHVLKRGDLQKRGKQVGPRPPGALLRPDTPELPPDVRDPRTRLARWLTDPAHPLAARVIANRVWQYHFGTGLVATPNDFGVNGSPPSHPELLDYLANALVAGGWRLKPLHRLILLSNTYRQASRHADPSPGMLKDPDDRMLWHFPRRRLTAEEIRDAMLTVAGRLNPKAGGPSVILPVDADLVQLLYDPKQWTVTSDAAEHDRRSVYLLAKRNLQMPFTEAFDQPDAQTSCARREASTHASQALELLNGRTANRLAANFANRLVQEAGTDAERQVELAYHLAAGRRPTAREMELAVQFLRQQPLTEFALAVWNLHAFLYVE